MNIINELVLSLGIISYQSDKKEEEEVLLLKYINDILQECASHDPYTPSCELKTQDFRIFNMLHYAGERKTIFFNINFDVFSESPRVTQCKYDCSFEISANGDCALFLDNRNISHFSSELRNMATVFQYAYLT